MVASRSAGIPDVVSTRRFGAICCGCGPTPGRPLSSTRQHSGRPSLMCAASTHPAAQPAHNLPAIARLCCAYSLLPHICISGILASMQAFETLPADSFKVGKLYMRDLDYDQTTLVENFLDPVNVTTYASYILVMLCTHTTHLLACSCTSCTSQLSPDVLVTWRLQAHVPHAHHGAQGSSRCVNSGLLMLASRICNVSHTPCVCSALLSPTSINPALRLISHTQSLEVTSQQRRC